MTITQNIKDLQTKIPKNITLVAAVKYATEEQIQEAINAGITDLGFNRIDQMQNIAPLLKPNIRTHFIGTLQSNKVKRLIQLKPYLIQSIDSDELLDKVNSHANDNNIIQKILIQINTDKNKTTGIKEDNIKDIITHSKTLNNISIEGLMTVPPNTDSKQELSAIFQNMTELKQQAETQLNKPLKYLSMGMTNDYKLAIENGSTMVRIGSKIFR